MAVNSKSAGDLGFVSALLTVVLLLLQFSTNKASDDNGVECAHVAHGRTCIIQSWQPAGLIPADHLCR